MKNIITNTFLLLMLLAFGVVYAQKKTQYTTQDKSELEKRRISLIEEIKKTQAELSSLQKDKQSSVRQLEALQAKLRAREELIDNINKEASLIEKSIANASSEVQILTGDLSKLKKQYAEIVRYTYKKRSSYDMLVFLFSAQGFNDAVKRMQYVRQYRDYRKKQAESIISASNNVKSKINLLSSQKQEKTNILIVQQQQQQELANESIQKAQVVQQFKGKEKELLADISKKQKDAQALNKAIASIIKREIELARKKAEEERKKELLAKQEVERKEKERQKAELLAKKRADEEQARIKAEQDKAKNLNNINSADAKAIANKTMPTAKGTGIKINKPNIPTIEKEVVTASLPPKKPLEATMKPFNYNEDMSEANKTLSNDFESNRGRLSAPVSGYICEKYGKNKHPVFNITTENFGVDIRTNKGAVAKAVFGGVVGSVFSVAGTGYTVLINHGKYFTVYSKLQSTSVTVGTKVNARQSIGTVMTNEEGNTQCHFEIWQVGASGKSSTVNPQLWIIL